MEEKKITDVVAALFRDGDRFFICRRPEGKKRAHLWEFAGGKTEPGETKEEALKRECMEELGAEVKVGDLFLEVFHEYPDLTVRLSVFNAEFLTSPRMLEHEDLRWIRAEEIPAFEFCPADEAVLKKICKEKGIR